MFRSIFTINPLYAVGCAAIIRFEPNKSKNEANIREYDANTRLLYKSLCIYY